MSAVLRLLADRTTGHGAGIMFIARDTKRVLWVKRSNEGDAAGLWAFPGGGVDGGETIRQAAVREAWEEVGFKDAVNLIHLADQKSPDFVYHTFIGRIDKEFTPVLNDEHTDWVWLPIGQYPGPIHPGIKRLGI